MQAPDLIGFTREEKIYILAYLENLKTANGANASAFAEEKASEFLEKYRAKFPNIKDVLK